MENAFAAGFKAWSFEKTRDRNITWKSRRPRVPLKEGRLWIKGGMAISYARGLGRIIGESLETALEPFSRDFAETHGLYFDKKEFIRALRYKVDMDRHK
ncbi:MAG: hypothetical protein LBG43_06855 [Treponema sp.]|nr:hypothetical protein [Treponema sp.]